MATITVPHWFLVLLAIAIVSRGLIDISNAFIKFKQSLKKA